jgi:uncharacterized protein YktA (UPF0223 family)
MVDEQTFRHNFSRFSPSVRAKSVEKTLNQPFEVYSTPLIAPS